MEQELLYDSEWLDTKGVAKHVGISRRQASKYLNQIPPPWAYYLVTPTKKLTKRADLDTWLESRKVEPAIPKKS